MSTPLPPTPGAPRALRLSMALLCALVVAGVGWMAWDARGAASERQETMPHPEVVTFSLDDPELYFMWTDQQNRLQTVRSLDRVPEWSHYALEVWRPQWGPRPQGEGGYLVVPATRDEAEVVARLRSRAQLWAASQAADAGEAHGRLTAFLASEVANRHPDSARSQALPKTRALFEEIEAARPLNEAELIAFIRANGGVVSSPHEASSEKREARE